LTRAAYLSLTVGDDAAGWKASFRMMRKGDKLMSRITHFTAGRLGAKAVLAAAALAFAVSFAAQARPVPAQSWRNWREAQARREREFQACMRPAGLAYQRALSEAQQNLKKAEREAEQDYSAAMHKAKSDAARSAARRAKQEALRKAQIDSRAARRAAQEARQEAIESCRNPKPPEPPNNNSGTNNSNNPADSSARSCVASNSTEGTLGHGPRRGQNPTVRMDLRVVDGTGRPVQGVKTKLWSERQSNGLLCEAFHMTDPCGKVLMDPIHITKNLQLELEAKGFEPQMIQVDPSQLDRPFRVVMQAKNRTGYHKVVRVE
jgi:hypothetical protein